jgi:hypothetical protein
MIDLKARISSASLNCILIIVLTIPVSAFGAEIPKVPFTLDRNRIIIPTSVNGSQPLKLILDTGMRFDGVYLFHESALKLIDTTGAVEARVPGAGVGEASVTTMIETGHVKFGEVSLTSQRVLV